MHKITARLHPRGQDAAARVLAGVADWDVAETRDELRDFRRATTASFNALREDMTDGFVEMRGKFDAMAVGQQQIVGLLEQLTTDQG